MSYPGGRTYSPDGRHYVELSYAGEIPFGPEYFTLEVDHRSFGDRIFGCALWSPDSSILVVTEWHTLDRQVGPITSLLLIRPSDWKFSRFPIVEKGFAMPNYFTGNGLILRHTDQIHKGGAFMVERETDLAMIDDWQSLDV